MSKKELPKTMRSMHGYRIGGRMTLEGTEQNLPPRHEWSVTKTYKETDKDALIAQLRASLELLQSREEKRRAQSREAMRKKRAGKAPA